MIRGHMLIYQILHKWDFYFQLTSGLLSSHQDLTYCPSKKLYWYIVLVKGYRSQHLVAEYIFFYRSKVFLMSVVD